MEILIYTIVWLIGGILFAMFLVEFNYPKKFRAGLKAANDIGMRKAEQLEILKHKWFESEKAGHDIGIEKANESWTKLHAKKWKASQK